MDGRRLLSPASRAGLLGLLALLLSVGSLALVDPGRATAAAVLVMGRHGQVRRDDNRFLGAAATPTRDLGPAATKPPAKKKPHAPSVTVPSVLSKLANSGQITAAQASDYLADWNGALHEEKHLPKARGAQLADVTVLLHNLATAGDMTASRLPVLFLTLERNAQWWQSGPMLSYGQRVQFSGSEIEWEYYPGQGLQLQVLGTFGEANGFYEAGRASWPELISLVDEMLPLAVQRGGGLAWEYYFSWEGGTPPWVSAMAQATALEALANAYSASGQTGYLTDAHDALGILETPPPAGVEEVTSVGDRFLQYSFAPHTDIINAFLQTLIGLDDYAKVSNDATALALFNAGNAEAQQELPGFNTGAWSLYQPGVDDDLSYHQLVTGFLGTLCTLTQTPVYCSTGQAFSTDLSTPPVLDQITTVGPRKKSFHLDFSLDKPAHVGVVVTNAEGHDVLYTSADCEPGRDYWIVPKLAAGIYTVRLSGTDLAGNYATTSGTLTVS